MSAPGLAARKAAGALLGEVITNKEMMSNLRDAKDGLLSDLTPGEKARAQSLALGVLRNLEPLDVMIGQFLNKSPPLSVMNVLRIAAHEMIIEDIPAHAAVDAAVNAVRRTRKTQHLGGLTNAVARRISQHGAEIWPELEPASLPRWIEKPAIKAYGAEAVADIAKAHSKTPPLDITVKKSVNAAELAAKMQGALLPTGSIRLDRPGQISALPDYDTGCWWVQDAAAAMPVRLLGDIKDARVLDLCAAPGGKTMQLADAGANVVALDTSSQRLRRVSENLKRTGLSAEIVTADALKWQTDEKFDIILLDAPCSASGTLRRHPDLPFTRPNPDLQPLFDLQKSLIDHALGWLKPDGRLLYCTCSLLPSEGEEQISKALTRHKGLSVLPFETPIGIDSSWISEASALRMRPDYWGEIGGMDGFFVTLLQIRA